MAAEPDSKHFVKVRTTLPARPLPSNAERSVVTTERLILKPFSQDDFDEVRVMRTQPEVMRWTSIGRIDHGLEETQSKIDPFLPPLDVNTHEYVIRLKETGEFVGQGGCHRLESDFGWPELGYMLKKEHWGKGYASEFVRAFIQEWSALPRVETELRVDSRTIPEGADVAEEQLFAVTEDANARSQKVLRNSGFEYFLTWTAQNSHEGSPEGQMTDLPTFRFFPGRKQENSN
ncbi:hypothetical protein VTK73DRAFT_7694 [Phialemonium thermophilum]|uniref:N-acetyltransferase domain-containing protein n=1 Tax=Phialemonium thermophilum TaxID=223376 RepID=A0ABR3XRN3_9PEZI